MRYGISYLSIPTSRLEQKEIDEILKKPNEPNSQQDICGFLAFPERNLYQLLGGEKLKIQELSSIIEKDPGHGAEYNEAPLFINYGRLKVLSHETQPVLKLVLQAAICNPYIFTSYEMV